MTVEAAMDQGFHPVRGLLCTRRWGVIYICKTNQLVLILKVFSLIKLKVLYENYFDKA